MDNQKTPTKTVMEMLNFDYGIYDKIPSQWNNTIRTDTNKPYFLAMHILSDIVLWYHPKIVKEEESNRFIRYEKKFKADVLQLNYRKLALRYGVSKRLIANACKHLQALGVISTEYRTVHTEEHTLNNVVFIDLNIEGLTEITSIDVDSGYTPMHQIDKGAVENRDTCTDNPTDNIHEDEDFSDLFPDEAPKPAPKRTKEDHRRGVLRARAKFFEDAGQKPWLTWFPKRIHPRDGIDKENIQHVGWLFDTITGMVPISDALWKRWRSAYASIYQEAKGDFDLIETTIHDKWDNPQYRATNPQTYILAVSATRAKQDKSKSGLPTMKPKVTFR